MRLCNADGRIPDFVDSHAFFPQAGVSDQNALLIVMLNLRIRARERETLFKIGCSRLTVVWLQTAELGLVIGLGLLIAAGLSGALYWYVVTSHVLI